MFTQTLTRRSRRSPLLELLTGPHGVDRYTELVDPTWTLGEARAKVVEVRRQTPRSVTLTLEPNASVHRISGRPARQPHRRDRRPSPYTRCYSPASAEGATHIELTIGRHDGGLVSSYLCDHARPGMVVGLDSVGGDFTCRRSGRPADPVRLRRQRHHPGDVDAAHAARRGLRRRDRVPPLRAQRRGGLLRRRARRDAGSPGAARLHPRGRRRPDRPLRRRPPGRRDARRRTPYIVCGPPALVDAVRAHCPDAKSESFVPPVFSAPAEATGGRISFTDSGVEATDDGRPLLEQAEDAGLTPESGCRMGICHTCTRRKTAVSVTQPDHRGGLDRRRGGRADLRVRPRRRRRDRPLAQGES